MRMADENLHLKTVINMLLLCAACADWKDMVIPGFLNILVGGLGLFLPGGFSFHIGGALWGFGLFMAINMIRPGSVGGGDIKLMTAAGMAFGKEILLRASVIGILAFLLVESGLGKKGKKRPLSPYLVGGILIAEVIFEQI